jgi:hypothetical protein
LGEIEIAGNSALLLILVGRIGVEKEVTLVHAPRINPSISNRETSH